MNSVWYWLCPGWDSMHSLLLESEKADINIQQCFELLCMLFTVGMSMVLLWTRTWITHVTSSSFLTFLWPYFLPSTKGIWLLCCCERCWPKWNVQDLMQKTQDLIFHINHCCWGITGQLKVDSWISCIYCIGLKYNTGFVFFTPVWMDI